MTEHRAGGRRRLDRVLDAGRIDGLASLADADLTARLEEAQSEETELSYIRRLLQGRLDILKAERERRASGSMDAAAPRSDAELVASLARVLADQRRGHAGGTGPVDVVAPPMGQRRRAAERAIDDVRLSRPASLDDDELAGAMDLLRRVEAAVSRSRREVHRVLDAMTAEIDRRVGEGATLQDRPLP